MEIWKPIPNYENLYEVSNHGRVRSICGRYGKEVILKQCIGSKGYRLVTLCGNGKKKTVNVHRLVALLFVPNPDSLPCVNHIDENKDNNDATNLEWCSYYYNNVYGHRLTKSALKRGIPVKCVETGVIYPNGYAASRDTGIPQGDIWRCCHKQRTTAGGYTWVLLD